MSLFRNHSVIIASLFLPETAVLGEDIPETPEKAPITEEAAAALTPQPLRGGPLKSIVEDLKDKTRHGTPSLSPREEPGNPFAGFNRTATTNTLRAVSKAVGELPEAQRPPLSRGPTGPGAQSAHMNATLRRQLSAATSPTRMQRRHSRSQSQARRSGEQNGTTNVEPWHVESNPHCNGGLRNAIESVGTRLKRKVWVGTLGMQTDSCSPKLRRDIDRRMAKDHQSLPVWIPDDEFEKCYDEFCHQVLWPCLHYVIPDAPKTTQFFQSSAFKQYVAVNKRFADVIADNWKEGDVIFVNDYHLMMLPLLLRQHPKLPHNVPIGFFMHVAFPSSEIFKVLPMRHELLKGVLGADLVGFQTANFARHFRQTVSRILSYEALPKGIQVPDGPVPGPQPNGSTKGRFVDVGVYPMGIDVNQLEKRKKDPEVAEWVNVLQQRYAGMKMIVGRDKLDGIQGVRQKIQAFDMFLERNPEWQGKVVLIQVALQTTEANEVGGGVSDLVAHVNSKFSTLTYQPIVFLHTQDLTFSQYLALLTVADVFLVTSLREGMALRAHEFVECQEGRHRPLVLSEFTGSYSYSGFRSCIAINPWDARGTSSALAQALTMSDDEALSRWEDLHNHVITQTAQAFVTSFLSRCVRAHLEHIQPDVEDVTVLDAHRVVPRYKHSSKRMLFIDLEGTLYKRDVSRDALLDNRFDPPEAALEILEKLVADKRNEVWLMSGLPRSVLQRIADRIPRLGIIAENGCFIKTLGSGPNNTGEWINMVANFNLTWKASALEILNYFTERTPGAVVEEREASLVWRFWTDPSKPTDSPDRQWARWQAAEAQNHIFDSLGERFGLRIIPGANSFLVLPNNISRSTAVGAIMHPGGPAHSPLAGRAAWMRDVDGALDPGDLDFALVISGDEKLLRRMNDFDQAETCSTSGKGTEARWKLDPEEVLNVLGAFVKAT
ncbi:uncharacterized protein SCHCODRAFT_02629180 [Schizophyllum commune H4-8]|uniref:uncharacterized protein n=1 Tax=Schizophyllum commune (strain H4-8 / FGSC 9210) TaxID=578458 RepID=UPI00216077DB|nr:uncharacterized protein SCHCODRAFT_02629180 [Schizophyllum commune H4-8]KAI5891466.1 hypothetical protein SCHCODRAFT_02629180 [Schizophyllum commune H4-8]